MSSSERSQKGVETHCRLSEPLQSSPLLLWLCLRGNECDRKRQISHANVNGCDRGCGLHGRERGHEWWCGCGYENDGVRGHGPRLPRGVSRRPSLWLSEVCAWPWGLRGKKRVRIRN